jgi:chlorobactene glucosyltransferase
MVASPGECLVLPAVFLGIAASRDFRRVDDPSCPDALANGQFMLFRREAYEALGGHGAVRGEVGEDLAFATLVKGSGRHLAWAFGEDLITTRMYSSLGEVWRGFSKNMAEIMQVGGWSDGLREVAYLLALGWLGPATLVAALASSAPEAVLATRVAGASVGIMAAVGLGTLRELRVPSFYLLALPLGFTFHAALLVASLRRRKAGAREWKGRTYA